jgi:protein-tyrosine phosphatase
MPAVLFVCTANRIRSPLAAALFQRRIEERDDADRWQVDSTGTWTDNGLPALREAQMVAAEVGLDLSRHRSTRVETVDLTDYDLILTMTTSQRDALRIETPAARGNTLTLSEAAVGLAYDVDDPVGRPVEIYRRTLQELDDIITRGLPRVVALAEANAAARMATAAD